MRLQPKIEELLLALDLGGRWNDISDDLILIRSGTRVSLILEKGTFDLYFFLPQAKCIANQAQLPVHL